MVSKLQTMSGERPKWSRQLPQTSKSLAPSRRDPKRQSKAARAGMRGEVTPARASVQNMNTCIMLQGGYANKTAVIRYRRRSALESSLNRQTNGIGRCRNIQFRNKQRPVHFHRFFAQSHFMRDLFVEKTMRHFNEHLALSW
jgi:hypothetical protein